MEKPGWNGCCVSRVACIWKRVRWCLKGKGYEKNGLASEWGESMGVWSLHVYTGSEPWDWMNGMMGMKTVMDEWFPCMVENLYDGHEQKWVYDRV